METAGPPVALGLAALACLAIAFRALRRRRLHRNVPTSKVKGVFLGLNELKGKSRAAAPLTSRLAGQPCVWYAWSTEEEWEREVTDTDSEGKRTTRTESGWKTVARGGDAIPFLLEDSTGRIRVVPDEAEIEGENSFYKTVGRSHPLYYEHGPRSAIEDSTHRRRLSETILPADADLYVLGTARMRSDVVEPEIAAAENDEIFLISTRSEEQISGGHFWGALVATILGAAAAGGAGWMLARTGGAATGAAGFLGLLAVVWLVLFYNGLVMVRERVEMSESMLDVQLRRRAVLVPRLQACVEAIAGHERTLHERVAALRAKGDWIALAEDYPELKADAHFRKLQDELVDTEDRIALAREFVNNSVTAFNQRVEEMPGAVIARLFGFRRREWLG